MKKTALVYLDNKRNLPFNKNLKRLKTRLQKLIHPVAAFSKHADEQLFRNMPKFAFFV